MRLEDQVASLELCKRLKELGAPQESAFYWSRGVHFNPYELLLGGHSVFETADKEHKIAAFTVAELGEMLPVNYHSWSEPHALSVNGPSGTIWACKKWHSSSPVFYRITEADARAKMLIHLIEKGIVKP